jgi:anti-sigma regulatory factor (Ser/Thr protein kinase)
MTVSNQVSALRVADEEFLIASTIERCPKTMMIRELFMNAIEAATKQVIGEQIIDIKVKTLNGVPKLSIINTGPGMSDAELYHMCDIAASIGKEMGLDENFGMGAKVASLPSNKFGLRYRSSKEGVVSEVILCQRDGIYGRLRRENGDEVIDVTESCKDDGYPAGEWTEVALYGNAVEQDTVRDPYNGDPRVPGQWLADYLYHRFYRLPAGLAVKFYSGTHKLGDGTRNFKTIPERAYRLGRAESVPVEGGIVIHYFFDPPLSDTTHNSSVSGAITSDLSTCALVYKNEFYDLKKSRQWSLDAPMFGVPFGAKHISIHIELPEDIGVRPEAYRQFLRYRDGDQRQVAAQDFASVVRENRPQWLIEIIKSYAPADSGNTNEIQEELQKLLNTLRLKTMSPRADPAGDVVVDRGAGPGARIARVGEGRGDGKSSLTTPDDLLAIPKGAKRAVISLNAEKAPEIIPLTDPEQIEEKGLKEKAAKFYKEGGQLFVNMLYPALKEMRLHLEQEYAAAPDPEVMRGMALKLAERAIVTRIGRAVVYALAKQLNREWTSEDVERAQSPESLSLAADDYVDALQNARRRMGQALRIGKQEEELETL